MAADRKTRLDTLLAHAGAGVDERTGAVVPGIDLATTFARDADYELRDGHLYGRYSSPTCARVETLLCALEGGEEALAFASGMSVVAAVADTLKPGGHVVAPRVMYHGAQDWLIHTCEQRGIEVAFFEAGDAAALADAVRPGRTEMVWIETPVNPTWDVVDIEAAAEAAHAAGAFLCVDSTVAPPVTTRALALGADFVMHSATKYLNGHSDVLAGALIRGTRSAERWPRVGHARKLMGTVLGPFGAWLLLRGLRTLSVRFERQSANALALAQHFEHHPRIQAVLYPGLASHPGHAVAARQMTHGYGGMMSLLIDGDAEVAKSVASSLEVFLPATSLGGVESLVEHRATVEGPHSVVPVNLLRLSIGIESVDDLIADLDAALARLD